MALSRVGTGTAVIILAAFGYIGARGAGAVPPLGNILDPANGLWASAQTAEFSKDESVAIPGLSAETRVVYDDRDVPHIFAPTVPDAYRALGYVVARDRLFQMEMQARAGAGTLTELAGKAALELDQQTRDLGMPRAAERRAKEADTTSQYWTQLANYTEGVNSYISSLKARDYPIEYKLLHRKPEYWNAQKTFNLMMRMGWTLASSDDELTRLKVSAAVGKAASDALFPAHAPIVDPIQPNLQNAARFDSITLPPPGAPDTASLAVLNTIGNRGLERLVALTSPRGSDAVGSNSWAVSPSRSASGHALLAGDPHLELSLPSIWYEVHLVVPGKLDVYGVTIPGAPGVVIGFNKNVAWTFTNVGADVMDYYLETVDDAKSPKQYKLDGAFKPLELRQEIYRGAKGEALRTDTVRFTHRGPMAKVGNRWVSVRWTVLESNRDSEAFAQASTSASSQGMLDSAAAVYDAPAQNMLAADNGGEIAIRSTGRYPIRPDTGRGDILRDGSTSSSDWIGRWAVSEYPQSRNPTRGFLSSNNQEPLDPRDQPRYLGTNWERPWRGMRINELLRKDSAVTPEAMRLYQSDPGSARADFFVPAFLAAASPTSAVTKSEKLMRAAQLLREWDRRYTKDNSRAVLFESAMSNLSRKLWDELRVDSTAQVPMPEDMITAALISQPNNIWWDDHRTTAVETRDVLLASALEDALDAVTKQYGEPTGDNWRWDHIRFANIYHLLRLAPFSRLKVPVQGGSATLWPSTGNGAHGPSWRMVVELGPTIRGWATYPGGQSGNPLSARYDNRVDQWSLGQLDSLRVPSSEQQLSPAQQHARLVLTPRR
ncbi:MAG: penicillin acylase family protein [Gemmatimonadaceae bacterium]